jgi:hypothetical protein
MGWVAYIEGHFSKANDFFERCILHCEESRKPLSGLAQAWSGFTLRKLDQNQMSVERIRSALHLSKETGTIYALLHGLPAAASILVDLDKCARAVEVYEVALQFPHVANAQLFEDVVGKEIKAVEAELPPEVVAQAKARGRAADPWQVAAKLAVEFAAVAASENRA